LSSYKAIIIFVIIKPLHPKLAHAFGYQAEAESECKRAFSNLTGDLFDTAVCCWRFVTTMVL